MDFDWLLVHGQLAHTSMVALHALADERALLLGTLCTPWSRPAPSTRVEAFEAIEAARASMACAQIARARGARVEPHGRARATAHTLRPVLRAEPTALVQ
jgi:hypothetical protein